MAHIRKKKKKGSLRLSGNWPPGFSCRPGDAGRWVEWEGLAPGVMEGSGRLGFLYMFFPYMLYSPGEHLAKPDPGGCPLRAQQFGLKKKNIYCCFAQAFSSCGEPVTLWCSLGASHCSGSSCCEAQALGSQTSVLAAHVHTYSCGTRA